MGADSDSITDQLWAEVDIGEKKGDSGGKEEFHGSWAQGVGDDRIGGLEEIETAS